MAESNIVTWNLPNWITIFLMVILGFMLVGMAARIYQSKVTS